MSITLKKLSEELNFETTTDLETGYSTNQILDLLDYYDIENYLEWKYDFRSNNLSDYSDYEIEDEFEYRGLSTINDSKEEIDKVVQAHRMGLLKVEGKHADLLIELLYERANKVV